MLYQPDGQRMLYQGLSAFISVHPVKKMLYNNMHANKYKDYHNKIGFLTQIL
jgi:hypothetical protein